MSRGISLWIDVPLKDLAQRVVSAGLGSRPILCEGPSGEQDLYSQVWSICLLNHYFSCVARMSDSLCVQAYDKLSSVYFKRENLYLKSDVRVPLEGRS